MIGLVVAVSGAVGGEGPVSVLMPAWAPLEVDFGVSPTRLPAGDPGQTSLTLGFDLSDSGSYEPFPTLAEATFGLDRSIRLEPKGLPVCRRSGVNAPQIDAAGGDKCPHAIVGRADGSVAIAFPESTPITISAKGPVYYGGTRGEVTYLMAGLPFGDPLSGTVWLLMPVRPARRGPFGSEVTVAPPTLAGGAARITRLQLDLRRGFEQEGERTGYVSADCPTGKLIAGLDVTFVEGSRASAVVARPCGRSTPR